MLVIHARDVMQKCRTSTCTVPGQASPDQPLASTVFVVVHDGRVNTTCVLAPLAAGLMIIIWFSLAMHKMLNRNGPFASSVPLANRVPLNLGNQFSMLSDQFLSILLFKKEEEPCFLIGHHASQSRFKISSINSWTADGGTKSPGQAVVGQLYIAIVVTLLLGLES
jgi:hypothetical protein